MMVMMGLMMVVPIVIAGLLLILTLQTMRQTGGKAKRTEQFEKPKRYHVTLGDDGELMEIEEDLLVYAADEQQ